MEENPESGPPAGRVPLPVVLAWGLPSLGLGTLLFFLQFYFLNFATDELLLAPALVGVLFALGRAWDALSDPIVGTRSDRTRSRLGRRRPWMLAGVPLLVLFALMTWIPPRGLEGAALGPANPAPSDGNTWDLPARGASPPSLGYPGTETPTSWAPPPAVCGRPLMPVRASDPP